MLWPKNNSFKEFDDEQKFLRLEMYRPLHHVKTATVFFVCFDVVVVTVVFYITQITECQR